jgi:hypothetical protein
MGDTVTYISPEGSSIIGGHLDDRRLGLLFRWGMPQDTERIRATYPGTHYNPRFRNYSVEYFGIGIDPDELSPHELAEGNLGGGCIQFYRPGKGLFGFGSIRILCAWLCRVRSIKTRLTLEKIWDPVFGWQTMIGNFDEVPLRHRKKELELSAQTATITIHLERGAIVPKLHLISKGGRPDDSGFVVEENKEKAIQFVIEKGRYIYTLTGEVSKLDVARACTGRYGITSGQAGCKAIDRIIKKCNPSWTWRNYVLPRIKESPTS